jgi:BirA family transcriptional regulator, biotin operon repressor / biotin---[acetyl-CoA-carboxylase] ligase
MSEILMSASKTYQWLHYLETCPSTNTWAIANSAKLNHGDVVFTQQQMAGRGQYGRTWHSPTGVLTTSIILDQIPALQLPTFSLAAGLAVIYAVEDLLPNLQGLQLKWPNDILLNKQKLAGILCEASANTSTSRVVVGIGLNVNVEFEQSGINAISLHQVSSKIPEYLQLLERLRHYLLETASLLRLENKGISALLPALRSRDALIGQEITVDLGKEKIAGLAVGISDRGYLQLKLPNGEMRSLISGHIFWQNRND